MGEVRVRVKLDNDRDLSLYEEGQVKAEAVRCVEIDAMVDTGAVTMLLPQDVVESLGLKKIERVIVTLANDEKIELDVAATLSLTACNRKMKKDCLVGPPLCEPLIRQLVLDRFNLVVDPLRQTITPRPESPYLPSLKLK